ncbi:MAG TPA: hypothetical protein VF210_08675 [Pseudomonadales bacterium]
MADLLVSVGRTGSNVSAAPKLLERNWQIHQSEHFRLLTDVDERAAASRLNELEMFRSVVLGITGRGAAVDDATLDVVVFSRHRDFTYLFGDGILGFFLPTLRVNWMVGSAGRLGASQRQVLFLLFSTYATMPTATANEFYVGAWELVHYLHAGHFAGAPNRFQQMVDYLAALQRGHGAETAFAEAFDITPLELGNEVQRYLQRGRIPRVDYPTESFAWSGAFSTRVPDRAEIAYRLARSACRTTRRRPRRCAGCLHEPEPAEAPAEAPSGADT